MQFLHFGAVAQLVERKFEGLRVGGSSPPRPAKYRKFSAHFWADYRISPLMHYFFLGGSWYACGVESSTIAKKPAKFAIFYPKGVKQQKTPTPFEPGNEQ